MLLWISLILLLSFIGAGLIIISHTTIVCSFWPLCLMSKLSQICLLLKQVENSLARNDLFQLFILQLLNFTQLYRLSLYICSAYCSLTESLENPRKFLQFLYSAIQIAYTNLLEFPSQLPQLNEVVRLCQSSPFVHHSPGCIFKLKAGKLLCPPHWFFLS